MKIRCSSIGKIMADAKGYGITEKQLETLKELEAKTKRTEKQDENLQELIAKRDAPEKLSQGAETYIKSLVNQEVFQFKSRVYTPEMRKGHDVEDDSIELFNEVFGSDYVKNEVKAENDYIQGECDILSDNVIIDIKSSWSLETFPALPSEGINSDYEYQLRGYMMLYNVDSASLAYCMVTTPNDLRKPYESSIIHEVDHIEPRLRISILEFERNKEIEKKIISKVKACRIFYNEYKQLLLNKNA